ncbi:MAG TPA: ubiquinol-cytochrome C chaperone family protein [Stellaceae bacterium]|nr:ubiquinol-cytochrome C chaperone family protein [Stellaceae bacterium]
MGIAEILGFRAPGEARAAGALYTAIVARAREPRFFSALGVPDTLDGRFETVVLHVILLAQRLKSEPSKAAAGLSRALLESFVTDMDRSIREMGAADLGVGRRVTAMAEGLYGRLRAYEAAVTETDDAALEAALQRNLYGTVGAPDEAAIAAVSDYVRRQHVALARQSFAALQAGQVAFVALPDPVGSEVRP